MAASLHIFHYLCTARVIDGGVPKAAIDLCVRAAQAGHRTTFATWDAEVCPPGWKDGSDPRSSLVMLTPPKLPMGLFAPGQLRPLRAAIAAADVVHLHAMWTPSNVQVARLARAHGTPYVLSPHGMLDGWCMTQGTARKELFLRVAGSWLLRHASWVHFTARAELDQARRYVPHDRAKVLPLAMDLAEFATLPGPDEARRRFDLGGPEAGPLLLFLGRLHPKKGLDHLLRAAAVLRESGTPVRLAIAGTSRDDYAQRMKQLANDLGLGDAARFLGDVTGAHKIGLYQAADLFVLPTAQENFGFVFFEALLAGTPVVTTRGVDTWRELESSGGATIFDLAASWPGARAAEAVAAAVREGLARNASEPARGARGRAWAMRELDGPSVIERFVELYRSAAPA